MQVSDLRNYGAAFSDAEGNWPHDVKQRMRTRGRAVVMSHLGPRQKLQFLFAFLGAKRRAQKLDLSDLRAKGMTNEDFLAQQLEYLAAFSALARVLDTDRAVEVMKAVMDATAHEPLLLCLPEPEAVRRVGSDALEVFRDYFKQLGIEYKRSQTLACGGTCCDFRFERE